MAQSWTFGGQVTRHDDGSLSLSLDAVPVVVPVPDPEPDPIPDPVPSVGWTELLPSADSRLIYVSSSAGDDTNDGLSESTPLRTIAAARTRVRNGFPDWVLLKRGDTFTEGRLQWDRGGRSPSEKLVLTAYGSGPRPVLQATGFIFFWRNYPPEYSLDNLAITHLDFQGRLAEDGSSPGNHTAILFSGKTRNHLIEGCRFAGYGTGVTYQWQPSQVIWNQSLVFRRNVVADCEGVAGLLVDRMDGITIEDNVFDHNGWGGVGASIFDHNVYLLETHSAWINGNIFSRGSNFGTKLSSDKPGAFTDFLVEDNLYFNNGIGIDHSDGSSGDIQTTFTHQFGTIRNNVFTELGRTFANGGKQDLCAHQLNSERLTWENNLFVHKPQVHYGVILAWGGHHKNATIKNNIAHDWHQPESSRESDYFLHLADRNVDGMTASENAINQPDTQYVDPARTVGSYHASIGGSSSAIDLITRARQLSMDTWDSRYTAAAVNKYMRAGFAVRKSV